MTKEDILIFLAPFLPETEIEVLQIGDNSVPIKHIDYIPAIKNESAYLVIVPMGTHQTNKKAIRFDKNDRQP